MIALDLFAGPGGWDIAATELGIDVLGIEFDERTCLTREAAGLRTLRADVASLDPLDFAPCELMIASPPCQTFSSAGKGEGVEKMSAILAAVPQVARGEDFVRSGDPRTWLVLEPLRWAEKLRPKFIALEQVPAVLPIWQAFEFYLQRWGYDTRCGILSAEQYGVPQTRKRAILVASLEGRARLPQPSHSRYYPTDPQRFDPFVLPWVSMAEALGWNVDDIAGFPRSDDTGTGGVDGYRERDFRAGDEPAFGLTEKVRSWTRRASERPSHTLCGESCALGGEAHRFFTRPAPTVVGSRRSDEGMLIGRQLPIGEERNPTKKGWAFSKRPSTTVLDNRITPPGHRDWGPDGNPRQHDGVRVTIEEAAALQSFPPSYPWQGSRTSIFQQIGNAIPPYLAKAILSTFSG